MDTNFAPLAVDDNGIIRKLSPVEADDSIDPAEHEANVAEFQRERDELKKQPAAAQHPRPGDAHRLAQEKRNVDE